MELVWSHFYAQRILVANFWGRPHYIIILIIITILTIIIILRYMVVDGLLVNQYQRSTKMASEAGYRRIVIPLGHILDCAQEKDLAHLSSKHYRQFPVHFQRE